MLRNAYVEFFAPHRGGDYMGGSVHQRNDTKNPRWHISLYWKGKHHRFSKHPITGEPFASLEEAKMYLNVIRSEIDRGVFRPTNWKTICPLLISQYAPNWLEIIDVSPNTLRGYTSAVNNYILPFFGNRDIRDLWYNEIVQFQGWIDLSDKGKKGVMGVLKTMLYHAWRMEDMAKVPPFPKLKCQAPDTRYLTIEQQRAVLYSIPEVHRPIFIFMMETGCRPGEARAVQRDCIKEKTVIIKRVFSDNELRDVAKKKYIRHVPITNAMAKMFGSLPHYLSPFVFVQNGGKPYTGRDLNVIWRRACDVTGIKIKLFDGVRHSMGHLLSERGASLDVIADQLGHQSLESTQRYDMRNLDERRKALEQLGKIRDKG